MSDQRKWDARYLEMAKLVSTWSKDPSTQTGAVIIPIRGGSSRSSCPHAYFKKWMWIWYDMHRRRSE